MDKYQVARMLDEIAHYIQLSETNPFKSRAFERAARRIETLDRDLTQLVSSGELYSISGIGKGIGPVVTEIVTTGDSSYLEELREQYPPGIFDLLRIPNLGLKKIGVLYERLGVTSIDELEKAAKDNLVSALPGFGAKTQQKILHGVAFARKRESQFLLPRGLEVGELVREQLASIAEVEDAEVAGSVRRRLEIIRNVNIVVSTRAPEIVIAALPQFVADVEVIDEITVRGIARGEMPVLFHFAFPENFGLALMLATGSKAFIEGFAAKVPKNVKARNEEQLFEKAGVPFVEPERREDAEELKRKKRPALVHPSDLRGTFHVHTTYSDGRATVADMLAAARERGFDYCGISDHSVAAYCSVE